eukprot:195774_1
MGEITVNKDVFWERLRSIFSNWERNGQLWGDTKSLVIAAGSSDEDIVYRKTSSLQLYLFGYELSNTVLLFTQSPKALHVLAGKKACGIFADLATENDSITLNLIEKNKKDNFQGNRETLLKAIEASGPKVGMLLKEAMKGSFVNDFLKAVKDKFELFEVASAVSDVLSVKSRTELDTVRSAGQFTSDVLKKYLQPEIETIVDEDKQVSQADLAEQTEDVFMDPKRVDSQLPGEVIETCYTPIIQSGGQFNLKPSAVSNEENLHYDNGGTIIVALGARFRSYCSNIARTFFFDPSKEQENVYLVLCAVFQAVRAKLRNGVQLCQVWEEAISVIRKKKPELENKFTRNCGFGMGLEFRDSSLVISKNNRRLAKTGMVFNLCVGFQGLLDVEKEEKGHPKSAKYACMIADTVIVTEEDPEILTHCSRKFQNISYTIGDSDSEASGDDRPAAAAPSRGPDQAPANGIPDAVVAAAAADGPRLTTRASERRKAKAVEIKALAVKEAERKGNQGKLLSKKLEQASRRIESGQIDNQSDNDDEEYVDPEAYPNPSNMPNAPPYKLHVDQQAEAVLVPVNNTLVPFHINVVKNVNVSSAGQFTYLRINFIAPTSSTFGRVNMDPAVLNHKNEMFIRELIYKSVDSRSINESHQLIKDLKKAAVMREKERKDRGSLVDQENLVQTRDRARIPRMRDLKVRPALSGKRKGTCTIEAHVNGFRIQAAGGKLDIVYKNIKHAFFQPAKNTISVLLHFHLKNPIMVGRKKTKDIAVFIEVVDTSVEVDARGSHFDQDGLMEEQRERQFRKRMNKTFAEFVKQSEEVISRNKQIRKFHFDMPFFEMKFTGVPNKQTTTVYPTTNCLVSLDDTPTFVLPLKDIEIAHFERVQFHLRAFDLVFVFKDMKKPVHRIDAIPMAFLEPLKQYLNDAGILYFVGTVNLDWNRVMRQINSDYEGFVRDGMWKFLDLEQSDAEGTGGDSEEGGVADAYNPTDDDGSEEESEDSEEFASEEESEEYSDEDNDMSAGDEEEEDEEGLSWEELEKQAAADDRKKRHQFDPLDQSRPAKRKRY